MDLDRIDLADIHAPRALANALHAQMPEIDGPVPVIDIAGALDIINVRTEPFDGFEGMLLTDRVRSRGTILASVRHGKRRARFTIAHELGHFLMERHVLSAEAGFRCRAQDMRETREGKRFLKQETQANQFAIGLLAPPRLFDACLGSDPDLRDAQRARDHLDISLEACIRRLVERRPERLAAVFSHEGRVRYLERPADFPYVTCMRGERLPQTTAAFRAVANRRPGFTEFCETHAQAWTRMWDLEIHEQTRVARNGHAVTLLWAGSLSEKDEEELAVAELGMPKFR